MTPYFTGAVLRPRDRRDGLNPVSAPPDPREAVRAALGGIADELAELPWRWPSRHAGDPVTLKVGPGAIIPVEGDPRDWWWLTDSLTPVYVESRSDARA